MASSIQYDGILVRASLEDTGGIPRSGPLQESPDVSPQGNTEVTDPKVYFTETYDEDVAQPIVADQRNLVYIRGKNTGEEAQAGAAYLYWANEADLDHPVRWKNNRLLTSDGSPEVTMPRVAASRISVGLTPFVYSPSISDVGADVALLGVIATAEHGNPIPGLGDQINFDRWIARQGGVGVLQATVEAPPQPTATFTTTAMFELHNTEGEVTFKLKAIGIPEGSKVSFAAAEPAPDGSRIGLAPSTVNRDPWTGGTFADLDANYASELTFDLFLPDDLPAPDNSITVYAGQYEEVVGDDPGEAERTYADPDHLEGDADGDAGRLVIQAQYTTKIIVPTAR